MKSPLAALLWRSLRVYQVFGANTDVGKTIFTTLLARTARKKAQDEHVAFLKPVSTGAADEADDRHLACFAPGVSRRTLYQYDIPCSPHAAALASGRPIPSDDALLAECCAFAAQCAAAASSNSGWLFMETAGGVHSPGPSGQTQANLYIPLRAPALLIGDSRLGGISQTIAAYESLRIRGYDVEAVLLFRNARYENHRFLADYFMQNHRVPVSSVAEPPRRDEQDARGDEVAMRAYYDGTDCEDMAGRLLETLRGNHEERLSNLDTMASRASQCIWYPFTQQSLVGPQDIMTIDSAHGDYFQTLAPPLPLPQMTNTPNTDITSKTTGNERYISEKAPPALRASFDASASWWTQGLGHSNPKLTLAAAHAAGRYGHVMFASAIHQPAISLAEALLKSMQNPRLRRVFYSDNGSTGTEVAVKMGLRAARTRYGWGPREKLHILGLKGAYHGDTMGAMDCADPGIYNEKIEWYEGKGYWLDYPTVLCKSGQWTISGMAAHEKNKGISSAGDGWPARVYDSLHEIFDVEAREAAGEHALYEKYITSTLQHLQDQGRKFGGLMLEPIILGAGGMQFVDPLFQRTLVNTVRKSPHLFGTPTQTAGAPDNGSNNTNDWTGLPVIFDEVFTGLYRLGRLTPSSFLGVHPDISVHAKLLTGGLVPLCATLASESIFNTFLSPDKTDALLHGHSYTAHPIGCQVALESLREMQAMDRSGAWDWAREQGWQQQHQQKSKHTELGTMEVWSTWPRGFVEDLSRLTDKVEGVWALGSVLAIHMRDAAGSGYSSNAAVGLRESLAVGRPDGEAGPWNVHSRVLGNVLYVMASQITSQESVRQLCELLVESLGRGVDEMISRAPIEGGVDGDES
ncbi:hypothetical protein E4U15_003048 [Claviceps sp. LM218 group G6]|nr:hypothetical protein E4U15_003048 [Claviceps sp. LM218 group G6]